MRQLVKALALTSLLASAAWSQITVAPTITLAGTIISASHSGTLYMGLPGNFTNATETNVQTYAGQAGTIANLQVGASAPGGSDTILVTVRKAAGDTTLTCTVSAAGTTCVDATHSFTVVATDVIDVSLVYSTAVTGRVAVSVTLTPSASGTAAFNGQTYFGGTQPTFSSCGTSPAGVTGYSNNGGTITLGTGTVSACTVTFGTAFTNAPSCRALTDSNASTAWVSAVSTAAVTFTLTQTGATKLFYQCN